MTVVDDAAVSSAAAEPDSLQRGLNTVVALAESGLFDEFVVYEDGGRWVFAGGVRGRIVLTAKAVSTTWRDDDRGDRPWSGSPADALARACADLTDERWTAYGWVGFGFAGRMHGTAAGASQDEVLAHLIVPEVEVFFGGDAGGGVAVTGSDIHRAAILSVLDTARSDAEHSAEPIDVDADVSGYRAQVAAAVSEIQRGEYTKVILSRSVRVPFDVDLPNTYRVGRSANTPARSFLLELGDLAAAGFSPELVVSVDEHDTVTTRPLAGTRAFGLGADLDRAAAADLQGDPKEISEHAVSVRLSFQELETIARADSTVVSDFMSVRERGSVQHLASTVRAQLRDGLGAWDAFGAVFPAVTASGIPKREAIEAIMRLEDAPRGIYSGAVVKTSSAGALEAALVLRAVYRQNGSAWLRAGAGIVGQSIPDREFEETCEKLGSVAPYLVRRRDTGSS